MQVAMEYEKSQGRQVYDVHEKNLGYDVSSLDLNSGDLRLIEIKGLGQVTGTILLTSNERRVAEDRRDCYWLYVVTNCAVAQASDVAQASSLPMKDEAGKMPALHTIKDPARFSWHEVSKVQHYWLEVNAMTKPMMVREDSPAYRPTPQDGAGRPPYGRESP